MPKKYILNAFYDEQNQKLVVRVALIHGKPFKQDEILIRTFKAGFKEQAKLILDTLLMNMSDNPPQLPELEHGYGYALKQYHRLNEALENPDISFEDTIAISLEMYRNMVLMGLWEHDRKN